MRKVAETHREKKNVFGNTRWSWFYSENFPRLLFAIICASALQHWWLQTPQSDRASGALVAWGGIGEQCQCPYPGPWWDAALCSSRWRGDAAGVWIYLWVAAEELVMGGGVSSPWHNGGVVCSPRKRRQVSEARHRVKKGGQPVLMF